MKHDFVFQKGDLGEHFYIILKGTVAVLVGINLNDTEYEEFIERKN